MIRTSIRTKQDRHNTLKVALTYLIIFAIYVGPRQSEWCRDALHLRNHRTFTKNINGFYHAFTIEDLDFFDEGTIKINVSNTNIPNVCATKIRCKFQKNSDNGQTLTYFRNLNKKDQCPVRSIINILFRDLRLRVDTKIPLVVHATGSKLSIAKYRTHLHIDTHLREVTVAT